MTGSEKITVADTHTDAMLADELRAMLGRGRVRLTLGALADLALARSPYLLGGEVSAEDAEAAYGCVPHADGMEPLEFHEAVQREMDTAFRVFEAIQPDAETSASPAKTSEIGLFSPEWFADLIAQACQSMPSLTYAQAWDEVPLAMMVHLAVATARRNGAVTARPHGVAEALRQFRAMRGGAK